MKLDTTVHQVSKSAASVGNKQLLESMMAKRSYPSVLDIIGDTPMVKLDKINPNRLVTLVAKLEFLNPGMSTKDRIVLHIINDAEAHGLLKPGGTIIENTSGNTGAAVAMIAAARGYKAILTMPDKVSIEKQNALKAYGASIIVCPSSPPDSPEHYFNRAKALAAKTPNSFHINQHENLKNPEAHYLTTGPEIWEQTGGQVDVLVASGSTGGTISGIGKYLKEQKPEVKIIMSDPIGSIYYTYFKTGNISKEAISKYHVEGIGKDYMGNAIDFTVIDDIIQITDKEAFRMTRRLALEEGILAGGSSGANVWAAVEIAKAATNPMTIVTIIPDGGAKYLSKIYNDEWMESHQLLDK